MLRCAILLVGMSNALAEGKPAPIEYSRDVRPILSRHCFKCHGPDENARKAKLRLDLREGLVGEPGSGAVLIPGHSEESELIYRVTTSDPEEVMPPPATHQELSTQQLTILRRWVAEGAVYQQHWSFVAPQQPVLPKVARETWPRNPIDAFVLAALEARGMEPSPEANREVLARRLYLDLIGIPPTPEEVERFEQDVSSDAYEQLVDRLLASPHYGERWARLWLDLARYADTNGYEKDRPRSIWPWRDWVVNALNADMPFDQFTVEQLAGDMLAEATLEQRVATGFHRNSMINEEGGTDPLEYRFYGVVDRVAVTGTTWLGLTVGCAQCHTHKYDPITQKEYYQLMAFLNNADEPEMALADERVAARRVGEEQRIAAAANALAEHWSVENVRWRAESVAAKATSGVGVEALTDRSVLFQGEAAERDTYTLVLESSLEEITALRLETLTDDSLPNQGPGRAESGNFVLSEIRVLAAPLDGTGDERPLDLIDAKADVEQTSYPIAHAIDGDPATGWAVAAGGDWHGRHTAEFTFAEPVRLPGGARITVVLDQQHGQQHLLGRVRLSVGEPVVDSRPVAERRAELLGRAFERWLQRERKRAVGWELLQPTEATANVPWLEVQSDGSVFARGDQTKRDTYDLRFEGDWTGVTAIRLEVMPDERLPAGGPGRVHYEGPKGEFFLSELTAQVDGRPVEFCEATESYARVTDGRRYAASLAIDGDPQSGWSTSGRQGEENHAVFRFTEPLPEGKTLDLRMLFERYYAAGLGRFRLWMTRDTQPARAGAVPLETETLLTIPPSDLTYAEEQRLREAFLWTSDELRPKVDEIRERRRNLPSFPTTLVMAERPPEYPRPTHVHHRGEFLRVGERVDPGVPSVLPDLPTNAPRDRLAMARWLVATNNPLTARVTANRHWAALIGQGLVRTLGDFGYQGDMPSHPALLDWLAVQFMKEEWSVKRLHRLIVTSATYRQTSHMTPDQLERDPDNRWLGRANRRRMEAEMIRDAVLQVSGLLSPKQGGPGVFPPQPPGITTEGAYGPLPWKVSEGEDRYRRGLYTFMKRTAPYAMFATFDAPSGEACTARRDLSNTPLQALTLLNDQVIWEAAQALGRSLGQSTGTFQERLGLAFRRCLAREPALGEQELLEHFWQTQRDRLVRGELEAKTLTGEDEETAAGSEDPEQAAWVALSRVLLNLDEFVTRN